MKIKMICFTSNSGKLYLGEGDNQKNYSLEPGVLGARNVGIFFIDEEDKAFIEGTTNFKKTTIQYAPVETQNKYDAENKAAVKEINPFNLSKVEIELYNNAYAVNPGIEAILKENIKMVCEKTLNTDILPPIEEIPAPVEPDKEIPAPVEPDKEILKGKGGKGAKS